MLISSSTKPLSPLRFGTLPPNTDKLTAMSSQAQHVRPGDDMPGNRNSRPLTLRQLLAHWAATMQKIAH